MAAYARERAADHLASLAARGLDLKGFWDEAAEAVSSVVPHHGAPCWFTLDPASLLVTSHYDHDEIPELPPEWLASDLIFCIPPPSTFVAHPRMRSTTLRRPTSAHAPEPSITGSVRGGCRSTVLLAAVAGPGRQP